MALPVLLLTLAVSNQVYCSEEFQTNKNCPALFVPTDLGCKCGPHFDEQSTSFFFAKHFQRCWSSDNSTSVSISPFICMSYNESSGSITLGACPYNSCLQRAKGQCTGRGIQFVKVPRNRSQVNNVMCGEINRTGLLCSKCVDGLGPAVFHYSMPCVKCLGHVRGWLLYASLAFLFPTLFFILLTALQIHVSSCALDSVVLMCQVIVSHVNWATGYLSVLEPTRSLYKVLLTVYGIWNLDFFRYYIPPFCIDKGMTALQIVSLEYLVALYPLFLTAMTYFLIELHDRDCKVLVLIWRPFHRCFIRFRRQWNPKGTIIHAFATFFLLSYVKIAAVSFALLRYTPLTDERFKKVYSAVYVDPAIPLFSSHHIPYAVLGICSLLLFTILPLLVLALYPLRLTQHCLNSLHIKANFIKEVIHSLQGCYKDGTGNNGSGDLRCFAAVFVFFRLIHSVNGIFPTTIITAIIVAITFALSLTVGYMKPYKESWCNIWSVIVLMAIGTGTITITLSHIYDIFHVMNAIVSLPMLYIVLLVLITAKKKVRHGYLKVTQENACTAVVDNEESLPYRLLNNDLTQHSLLRSAEPVASANIQL